MKASSFPLAQPNEEAWVDNCVDGRSIVMSRPWRYSASLQQIFQFTRQAITHARSEKQAKALLEFDKAFKHPLEGWSSGIPKEAAGAAR